MTRRICVKDGAMMVSQLGLFRDPSCGIERASAVVTSRVRGAGLGGTRRSVWQSDAEMLEDNLLLAYGMEWKALFHDLPYGGGKVCVQLTDGADEVQAFTALARFLWANFAGTLLTTEDLGTTPEDMATMHRVAPALVLGRPLAQGGSGDPSPYTAAGVSASIAAVSRHVLGRDLDGVRVFVKGLGHVGAPVARELLQHGVRLVVCDVRAERLEPFRGHALVDIVPPATPAVAADIFVPCAKGGDVGPDLPHRVRAVCGAANNQLTSDDVAESLYARGIVYVPDWVGNGGGLISVAAEHLGHSREWAMDRARGIGLKVAALLTEAAARGIPPLQVAYEVCERNRHHCQAKVPARPALTEELQPWHLEALQPRNAEV